ncbi:TPA: endonuclease III domain-containing protein, partial [Candidatus Woesearchaeota archaeon]|nr:endonuclease III domain-containing protein [Candidatus Woesearchaeota archaeon]
QGWWPLLGHQGVNPTKTGSVTGYHPGDYSFPKDELQQFEICLGAILTQNTSWPQVEKALHNLKRINSLSAKGIKKLSAGKLREVIKPAGYYNQKAKYIREFIKFFERSEGIPSRTDVLGVKGVGNETADSILLYAFKMPEFVIDAYTKRIFSRLGVISHSDSYESIKHLFEENLEKNLESYQEYHALIVEHAKRNCRSKPVCEGCVLGRICEKRF